MKPDASQKDTSKLPEAAKVQPFRRFARSVGLAPSANRRDDREKKKRDFRSNPNRDKNSAGWRSDSTGYFE